MRLRELKEQTYYEWEAQHKLTQALIQPENFKSEIRTYGDLRRKQTWVDAVCRIKATNLQYGIIDAWSLATDFLNWKEGEDWEYEYRYQIFDEYVKIPQNLQYLRSCLEQLLEPHHAQEREESHGLLELVGQKLGIAGRELGSADGPLARLLAGVAGS